MSGLPPKADFVVVMAGVRSGSQTEVRPELSEFTIRFGFDELST